MRHLLVLALLALVAAPPAADARRTRPITLKLPPFDVPAHSDREICTFVELPRKGMDLAGWTIANRGTDALATSHHFIFYAYRGTDLEHVRQFEGKVVDSQACLEIDPDPSALRFVGGAQTPLARQQLTPGTALRMDPIAQADPKKPVMGFVLNSHWINGSDSVRTAHVKLVLQPAKKKVRRYQQPIFEVVANGFLKVPPGETKTVGWRWAPGQPSLGGNLFGGVENPTGAACVTLVTGHMHRRGKKFLAEMVDAQNHATQIYENERYNEPGQRVFSTPMLVNPGEFIRYSCTHDNATDVRMGCEEEPGVPPGKSIIQQLGSGGDTIAHPATLCTTDADCAGIGTGKCVPAYLVFGFHSYDEMCILPGYYYDASADGTCTIPR